MNFTKIIFFWYHTNSRQFHWRDSKDPYHIWVSEIIFQQTQIKQGTDYYHRFISRFPDIKTLALSNEQDVLNIWKGLGYYSRARNIHHAAKFIWENYHGIFPNDIDRIRKLKGVGDYTAAAIASLAFKSPYAAVDGNGFRVLARIFGIFDSPIQTKGKKIFFDLAQSLLDRDNPDISNQALIEFGALYCTPKKPDCPNCIFLSKCYAYANKCVDALPVKKINHPSKLRFFNYFFITDRKKLLIQQRIQNDIWKNLYEFPLIETPEDMEISTVMNEPAFFALLANGNYTIDKVSEKFTHVLSHQKIIARFFSISVANLEQIPFEPQFKCIFIEDFNDYPVSKLIERFANSALNS